MKPEDRDYFSRRGEEELDRASSATCVEAENAHAELAVRYCELVAKIDASASLGAGSSPRSLAEEQASQHRRAGKSEARSVRNNIVPFLRN